jgi:hypothetical protein
MRYVAQQFWGRVSHASGNSEFEISGQHIDDAWISQEPLWEPDEARLARRGLSQDDNLANAKKRIMNISRVKV